MVDREDKTKTIPIVRQCDLLKFSRSSLYYESHRDEAADEAQVQLLHTMDKLYTDSPHLGRRGMSDALFKEYKLIVNPKRVRRLMKLLGLEAVYPKPRFNTSQPNKQHTKYPYLLRNLDITTPDQVWCTDITYIRLYRGFAYLACVMDWNTRCVLSWELSNTLDTSFCITALQNALAMGRKPEIFNTDQGCQFTSEAFTKVLQEAGIAISMDGVGRAFDNIMIERLWRTVKYENVYIRGYETPAEARLGLGIYFSYYNHLRPHTSLDKLTPAEAYGLAITASDEKALATRASRRRIIETGDGRSVADRAAVAPVALRAPYATAAQPSQLVAIPPYSG